MIVTKNSSTTVRIVNYTKALQAKNINITRSEKYLSRSAGWGFQTYTLQPISDIPSILLKNSLKLPNCKNILSLKIFLICYFFKSIYKSIFIMQILLYYKIAPLFHRKFNNNSLFLLNIII